MGKAVRNRKPTKKDVQEFNELNQQEKFDEAFAFRAKFDWSSELTEENKKYGVKNCLGEQVIPNQFDDFKLLSSQFLQQDSRVVAQKDGKWGIVKTDGTGDWLIRPVYDFISFPNRWVAVSKAEKWGVLDCVKGEFIVPLEQDEVHTTGGFLFNNSIATFVKDGKIGLLDERGNKTKAQFDDVEFENDIQVKYQGEWGYANENGDFTKDPDENAFFENI